MGAIRVDATRLETAVAETFSAAGCTGEEAGVIAGHLVLANLVGHDSHGVIRLRDYIPWVEKGMVKPNRDASIVHESPVALRIDGGLGFGQSVGEKAVALAIAKARSNGLAILGVTNTGHLGRIGHWAERCAQAGLISLHFVNTSGFGLLVAPFGSSEARLSANPIAAGVPRPGNDPIILDMSTAAIAEGKIKVARNAGTQLPEGVVVDAEGRPTRDPLAFYGPPRGAIMPFGGHKGYGLSVILEVLAGALTGGGCTNPANPSAKALVNNMCSILIDPDVLAAGAALPGELDGFVAWLTSAATIEADGEILLPGDVERRLKAERVASGIPLDETTIGEIEGHALRLGVGFDRAALAV